jgi:hypothetical protein
MATPAPAPRPDYETGAKASLINGLAVDCYRDCYRLASRDPGHSLLRRDCSYDTGSIPKGYTLSQPTHWPTQERARGRLIGLWRVI